MLLRFHAGGSPMRYKVGAEQLQQVPTLLHRPDSAFRVSRVAPAGPTHAVSITTGQAACGIEAEGLGPAWRLDPQQAPVHPWQQPAGGRLGDHPSRVDVPRTPSAAELLMGSFEGVFIATAGEV
jgi:hypothetical protein